MAQEEYYLRDAQDAFQFTRTPGHSRNGSFKIPALAPDELQSAELGASSGVELWCQ